MFAYIVAAATVAVIVTLVLVIQYLSRRIVQLETAGARGDEERARRRQWKAERDTPIPSRHCAPLTSWADMRAEVLRNAPRTPLRPRSTHRHEIKVNL
jgi:hypothetical protein